MSLPSLAMLLVQESAETAYKRLLSFAQTFGLNTEAWAVGDPTRSTFSAVASLLATLEPGLAGAIAGGFLGLARKDFLTMLTHYNYNTDRIEAEAATCTVRLSNAKGGVFDFDPGDVTVKNSTTGATFRNTSGGHLGSGPGMTLDLDFEAEIAGADGSSDIGDIDTMVTVYTGVTCSNTTTAIGRDEEEDGPLATRASLKFESVSPNGPKGAYVYFATTPSLNGGANVNRARAYGNTTDGTVPIFVASPSGAALTADVDLVRDTILAKCTPLAITPSVTSASAVAIDITATIYVYSSINMSESEIRALVNAALDDLFARLDIGGDVIPPNVPGTDNGIVARSLIESTILSSLVTLDGNGAVVARHGISCSVTLPASDTSITPSQVPTKGTPTITVNQVTPP
jgi:uncharacterized phage protein gp47/JayE